LKSFSERLQQAANDSNSILCVGLDIDAERIDPESPPSLDEMKSFTKSVIEATLDHTCAFKLNLAFFEMYGSDGFTWLEETLDFIGGRRFTIGDGKRGDIGNTAKKYATAMFDHFGFDAVTLSPYMGPDSLEPFLDRSDRGVFILCLTSNPGSREIQLSEASGVAVYRRVISMVKDLNENDNCGLVVGATKPAQMANIRLEAGKMPFLIPGIGAQGGDLEASVAVCSGDGIGLINVSRAVLYADNPTYAASEFKSRINSLMSSSKS
tara:strand:- start:254 stop:1051 length:798 start_codon:yes stop_codon:yes gene_type:complete